MIMGLDASFRVLALDTSTPRGSVALLDGQELASELRLSSLETHSARLLRSIFFLLESTGWRLSDLNLVAAGIGPGSFTGIRIGIATALGLAQTLRIPFAGISGLDGLARQVTLPEGRLGVLMDAQRSQVYYAEYEVTDGNPKRATRPRLHWPTELRTRLMHRRLYLAGDGALRYMSQLLSPGQEFPRILKTDLFIAASIGRLALAHKRKWCAGRRLMSVPLYIRPPDAKRPKDRK
jgi:tRNA threonylcarbamoyladenosine biosynthesis protein TsaB